MREADSGSGIIAAVLVDIGMRGAEFYRITRPGDPEAAVEWINRSSMRRCR